MKKILTAVDFSEVTPRVIHVAASQARAFDAELWLLHVAAPDPDFVGFDAGPQSVRDGRAEELRQEHRELQDEAQRLRDDGVQATALLVQGPTQEKIVSEAERLQVDLIVVGSHGRGAIRRALLGSVSEGLLREAPCPVLIVPTSLVRA